LDEIARWCKYAGKPSSQIVIAAYSDDVRNRDRAEILTQEQADAVCKYLVDKHAVQSAGWFKTRKVAAVGFGTRTPSTVDPSTSGLPSRRIEIILFTPQT
jgi:phospholipid/cholesterol/gamma-HCH transport system substrate-binding protein